MSPNDATACFWYARNQLYFDLGLANHPDVLLCSYERLVAKPQVVMPRIYQFLEQPYPGGKLISHIHAHSVNAGTGFALSPQVESRCEGLMQKLDQVDQTGQNTKTIELSS